MFDQNELRGTLTGGATCVSNPTNDYYAKLNRMFITASINPPEAVA
ncbi:MAG: hypothetical protein R2756_11175 [Bacteroidales bacterium]